MWGKMVIMASLDYILPKLLDAHDGGQKHIICTSKHQKYSSLFSAVFALQMPLIFQVLIIAGESIYPNKVLPVGVKRMGTENSFLWHLQVQECAECTANQTNGKGKWGLSSKAYSCQDACGASVLSPECQMGDEVTAMLPKGTGIVLFLY